MATDVSYPSSLPLPLATGGFSHSISTPQVVGLFDIENSSVDETRQYDITFTFSDLQYKVFHGWFMHFTVEGQKWFSITLDGEAKECTFGGNQPSYTRSGNIYTVNTSIRDRVFYA